MRAIDLCKKCIDSRQSFVLQGGAGSGKTESLKELLLYIKCAHPNAKVICITHTNAAVDEIIGRIGDKYSVSTIHSFLYELIGNYKKNIKSVISNLFLLPTMERDEQIETETESEYKRKEYDKYKKLYNTYAKNLFLLTKKNCERVLQKREYDQDPILYNDNLNNNIKQLNVHILNEIESRDYNKICYNETQFNSLKELSYGHDGLLEIFHLLIEKFPLLKKILADKYDYIFIDEYQDTKTEIVNDILELSLNYDLAIGLFGDSMQSIYEDGIGSVEKYVQNNVLVEINKPDNYRCSYEVIKLINSLRLDDISQNVALKKLENGFNEPEANRHGLVKTLFAVVNNKPNAFSAIEEKEKFQSIINHLISEAKNIVSDSKVLMLTNKAIAEKNDFGQLYKVFNERYPDVSDRIENYLQSIQALDIVELCVLYQNRKYNELIRLVRKGNYIIHTLSDKKKLNDLLNNIINKDASIQEVINFAIQNNLIKQSETARNKAIDDNNFLKQLDKDEAYKTFKTLYMQGQNTYNRIRDNIKIASEEEFNYLESLLKRERFIKEISSSNLKFREILNYGKYLNEETENITMHKTKGTSIPSVVVVMEEYFWREYDFSLLYKNEEQNTEKKIKSQKLIYVACSRAKKNLICVRTVMRDEVELFTKLFPNAEEIKIPDDVLS